MKKTIVISAVNLNVGGTLAILRDCLQSLSALAVTGEYRVVAIVHQKAPADYPGIEYIETQWPKKRWVNRLWYEYVSMKAISRRLSPVSLWLSLHDTTPNVVAERRAVYCHNPFPFYKWTFRECFFAPKIVLFALFSKYIYRANIRKNDYLVVQQQWIKDRFVKMFRLNAGKIIVAAPPSPNPDARAEAFPEDGTYTFVFASSPNSHKNFECLCEAVAILQKEFGLADFKVHITVKGNENGYARWLYGKWGGGSFPALNFAGFLDRKSLYEYYSRSHCLVFPSKVETWGLPVSEFSAFGKPMLLADLPYAHETAGGSALVAYFDPESPRGLAMLMKRLIEGDASFLKPADTVTATPPVAGSWEELFNRLLQ